MDGLALQVTASGARSWVLRVSISGKQREMGLGSFPTVTLADARERARTHRTAVSQGTDPITVRIAAQSAAAAERAAQQNFASVAADYIRSNEKAWTNAKHAAQWTSTLRTYVEPVIGKMLVRDVSTAHVIKILEPIWTSKTETATRVRSRLELVLDFATARGLRDGPNPARWKGNLDAALPKAAKVAKVQHHAAVHVDDVAAFMKSLCQQPGVGAKALEFTILTAARSGEVRGACWREVDFESRMWVVPAERMKAGREHRVPLSDAAIVLLRSLSQGKPNDWIFPGMKGQLSDMSLTAVLRRMNVDVTVHGFRSTFRDWCSECTEYPREVAEMALAHAVDDKVEAAYRRGDLLQKRVNLMRDWAAFLEREEA